MAEPPTDRSTARNPSENASSGIRRRLRVFLRTDAVRVRRAGLLSGLLLAAGVAAGVLMIVTEFTHIRYVTSITASCSDFAGKSVRDGCLTIGHQSHSWAVGLLGLFAMLMAFGAAVGRSRPAAVALAVAGAVVLGITLLHDLPSTRKTGQIGFAFVQARAHKGAGFWLELIGGVLALVAGLATLLRLQRELRRAEPDDEEAAAA